MTLHIPGQKQRKGIFHHSQKFEAGLGNIRPGQATIVVALDGSGDADSIQEGINMLAPAGGVVYIKEGVYIIKKTITIDTNNIELCGAGKATQINISANNVELFFNTCNYVVLRNLYVVMSAGNGDCVHFDGGDDVTVDGVIIEDSAQHGIYLVQPKRCKIINSTVIDSADTGIYFEDGEGAIVANCHIEDNVSGIKGSALKESVIVGNHIDNSTGDGIILLGAGSDGNQINANVFLNMGGDAVDIDNVGASKNSIVGNMMVGFAITDNGANTIDADNQK